MLLFSLTFLQFNIQFTFTIPLKIFNIKSSHLNIFTTFYSQLQLNPPEKNIVYINQKRIYSKLTSQKQVEQICYNFWLVKQNREKQFSLFFIYTCAIQTIKQKISKRSKPTNADQKQKQQKSCYITDRLMNSPQPVFRAEQIPSRETKGQLNDRGNNPDNQNGNTQGFNSDSKVDGRAEYFNFYRDRHQKNKSQNLLSKEAKVCDNEEDGFKSLIRSNMTEAEYLQACKKYEQHIVNLESYVEKLKQQKFDQGNYLMKAIKSGGNPLKNSYSQADLSGIKMAAAFDINEYTARSKKQREQAKQIEEKATKLRQKEKLERTLLKKMRQKNQLLRKSQQFNLNCSQSKSNMGGSIISVTQNEHQGAKSGEQGLFAVTKSQICHENDEADNTNQAPPSKGLFTSPLQYPNILSQNESIDGDKSILNIENQLKQEIVSLKQEIQKLQDSLVEQKTLRQNYEKKVSQNETKNYEATTEQNNKIKELQNQLELKDNVINKLQYLLKENIKLIEVKDNQIRELEESNKQEKTKIEQLSGTVDKLQQKLAEQKQFGSRISKQESLVFGSDSQNSSPASKQKINIYYSTELLQLKLKEIEQKLHAAQTENRSLIQSQSSLENRLMCISEERILTKSVQPENQQLKEDQAQKKLQNQGDSQELKKQIATLKQQNSSFEILNQQYQSQIKSNIDLINKYQNIIQQNQEDKERKQTKIKQLQQTLDILKGEKLQEAVQIEKLKQEIVNLNEYIAGMNTEMVRSRIKEKQRQIQLQQKKQAQNDSLAKFESQIKQLKENDSHAIEKLAQNQKTIQLKDQKIRSLQKQLEAKQQQISILKLQYSQLEENSDNVEIQMDLLHKLVSDLNNQIKDKDRICKQAQRQIQILKNQKIIINQELQKNKLQTIQTKQYIEKIQNIRKQLQKEKQQTDEHLLHLQIQYDVNTKNLKNLQKQLETASKKIQEKQTTIIEQSQKIKQLQQLIEAKKEQLFISNIPPQHDQSEEKHSTQSLQIEKIDKNLSSEKFKENIDQFCEAKVKDYNKEVYQIFRRFVVNLVQGELMKDNKKSLQHVLPLFEEIFQYAENKYQNLQKYMNKISESVNKIPDPQSHVRTPEISSSPVTNAKIKVQQKKQLPKIKPKSLNLQNQIQQKAEDEEKQEETNKKSVLLSQDFNDAFSHEDPDDDRMSNRYNKADGVKQTSRSQSKDLGASGVSGTFARSTHSVMQQLQAQQSYKKNMRNLKMKVKQQPRRKL